MDTLLIIKLFGNLGHAAPQTDTRKLSDRPVGSLPLPLWCAVMIYRLLRIDH
jgi:hypothetical protein